MDKYWGLGIGIGVLALVLFYLVIMLVYFKIRKRFAHTKYISEIVTIGICLLCSIIIKTCVIYKVCSSENGIPEGGGILQGMAGIFSAIYSGGGGLAFEGLESLAELGNDGVNGFLQVLYTGSSLFAATVFVSVVTARASYEIYSYVRLCLPEGKNCNIVVFTALTEESITLAESINEYFAAQKSKKSKKRNIKVKIIFAGPSLEPFDRKNDLCRRVMSNGFLYWSYSYRRNKKNADMEEKSIAKTLRLNNKNIFNNDARFFIFAFDSKDHIAEEEANMEIVFRDTVARIEAESPDKLRIDYIMLTQRAINNPAYNDKINELSERFYKKCFSEINKICEEKPSVKIRAKKLLKSLKKIGLVVDKSKVTEYLNKQDDQSQTDKLYFAEINKICEEKTPVETRAKKLLNILKGIGFVGDISKVTEYIKKQDDQSQTDKKYFEKINKICEGKTPVKTRAKKLLNILKGIGFVGDISKVTEYINKQDDQSQTDKKYFEKINKICEEETTVETRTKGLLELFSEIDFVGDISKVTEYLDKRDVPNQADKKYFAEMNKICEEKTPVETRAEKILAIFTQIGFAGDKSKVEEYIKKLDIQRKTIKALKKSVEEYFYKRFTFELWNDADVIGRVAVEKLKANGLMKNKIDDISPIYVWSLGFGATAEAITNELFIQTPGVAHRSRAGDTSSTGKETSVDVAEESMNEGGSAGGTGSTGEKVLCSRPFYVNVFDKDADEVSGLFMTNHKGKRKIDCHRVDRCKTCTARYRYVEENSPSSFIEDAKKIDCRCNVAGLPTPIYKFNNINCNSYEFFKKIDKVTGAKAQGASAEEYPNVIVIATGDDDRNIQIANTIAKDIVNEIDGNATYTEYDSEKDSRIPQFIVVNIYNKNNNDLIATLSGQWDAEHKVLKIKKNDTTYLTIIIVGNMDEIYSFDTYMERYYEAIRVHNNYEKLAGDYYRKEIIGEDDYKNLLDIVKSTHGKFDTLLGLAGTYSDLFKKMVNAAEKTINLCKYEYSFDKLDLLKKASNYSVVSALGFYHELCKSDTISSKYDWEKIIRGVFIEHDRWLRFHYANGFTYNSKKNVCRSQHDCLAGYENEKVLGSFYYDLFNILLSIIEANNA